MAGRKEPRAQPLASADDQLRDESGTPTPHLLTPSWFRSNIDVTPEGEARSTPRLLRSRDRTEEAQDDESSAKGLPADVTDLTPRNPTGSPYTSPYAVTRRQQPSTAPPGPSTAPPGPTTGTLPKKQESHRQVPRKNQRRSSTKSVTRTAGKSPGRGSLPRTIDGNWQVASPPTVKVLLPARSRSPAARPQRYDGFPGVPAYVGSPGVIVFTPRPLSPRAANERHPSPPNSSSSDEEERARQAGAVTFMQVWTLGAVALATLTLPAGLLLLSYLATPEQQVPSATSSRTESTFFSLSTMPVTGTNDPFVGMPASCHLPVQLNLAYTNRTTPAPNHRGPQIRSRQIFCLFNVTRLGRAVLQTFYLYDMPFEFCQRIIYWSFGIRGGDVVTRHHTYDVREGLYKLGRTNLSVEIYLAVGGYPQESVELSRLGRDSAAMARFVTETVALNTFAYLRGIAIHWVNPETGCGRIDDAAALASVVDSVKRAYEAAGGGWNIAVMLSAEYSLADPIVSLLAPRVRYIFLQTHLIPPTRLSNQMCSFLAEDVIHRVKLLSAYAGNEHKICMGFSMAAWLAVGEQTGPNSYNLLALSNDTSAGTERPGTESVLEMCSGGPLCVVSPGSSCVVVRRAGQRGSVAAPAPFFLFHDNETLFRVFAHGRPAVAVNFSNSCGVIYDVDLDSFTSPCMGVDRFAHMTHFSDSMYNPAYSVFQKFTPCP